MEMLVQMYYTQIFLICHPNDWDVPTSVKAHVMNPQAYQTLVGRHMAKRIMFARERDKCHQ